ncbi:MAG: hypothetical protein KF819_36860 [Labilithrix sp.]|nr:hypothetical protein [Labilithrix sp.]
MKLTALQRHVAFFDPEGTGVVKIGQTWRGLGRLGVALHLRLVLTPIINVFLGYLTQGKPSLSIHVETIAEGKHPFDTGAFGDDGEIDVAALDALGAIATKDGGKAITAREMRALILARGNRRAHMGRVAGALGSWFSDKEVKLFFCIAADATKQEDGREVPAVTMRQLRRLYEGTLFHALARRRRMKLRAT